MVDPTDVTKFDRSNAELEEFLLFCVAVAGKTATQISVALDRFLANSPEAVSPFDKVRILIKQRKLRDAIIESKLGQHNKLTELLQNLSKPTLTCLESRPTNSKRFMVSAPRQAGSSFCIRSQK